MTATLIGLAAIAVVMGVTMAVSLRVGRVAVVDVAWGLMFVAVAIAVAVWSPGLALLAARRPRHRLGRPPRLAHLHALARPRRGPALREPCSATGASALAVRKVFLVQAFAAFVISLPLMVAGAYDVRWTWLVALGAVVWLVGLVFESVGDAQLAAYKALPKETKPPVMDRGLWRYTRHPNYFGDACVWWGIWLAGALATGWLPGLLTVVAPLAMTYFLAFATGARLLERTMMQRPGYPEYAARTSMFVPLPPRGE